MSSISDWLDAEDDYSRVKSPSEIGEEIRDLIENSNSKLDLIEDRLSDIANEQSRIPELCKLAANGGGQHFDEISSLLRDQIEATHEVTSAISDATLNNDKKLRSIEALLLDQLQAQESLRGTVRSGLNNLSWTVAVVALIFLYRHW